jgi:hypothetical protein
LAHTGSDMQKSHHFVARGIWQPAKTQLCAQVAQECHHRPPALRHWPASTPQISRNTARRVGGTPHLPPVYAHHHKISSAKSRTAVQHDYAWAHRLTAGHLSLTAWREPTVWLKLRHGSHADLYQTVSLRMHVLAFPSLRWAPAHDVLLLDTRCWSFGQAAFPAYTALDVRARTERAGYFLPRHTSFAPVAAVAAGHAVATAWHVRDWVGSYCPYHIQPRCMDGHQLQ